MLLPQPHKHHHRHVFRTFPNSLQVSVEHPLSHLPSQMATTTQQSHNTYSCHREPIPERLHLWPLHHSYKWPVVKAIDYRVRVSTNLLSTAVFTKAFTCSSTVSHTSPSAVVTILSITKTPQLAAICKPQLFSAYIWVQVETSSFKCLGWLRKKLSLKSLWNKLH